MDTGVGNPQASAWIEAETGTTGVNGHRFYLVIPVTVGEKYLFSGDRFGDISGTVGGANASARNWAEVYIGFIDTPTPSDMDDFGYPIYKKAFGNGDVNTSTGIWDWESITASPYYEVPEGDVFTADGEYMVVSFNLGGRADSGSTYFWIDNISVTEYFPCAEFDLTGDCQRNIEDLEVLMNTWLNCNRYPSLQCGL